MAAKKVITYDPLPGSGFLIEVEVHTPKTSKGKKRFYVKCGSDNKNWEKIFDTATQKSASVTFQEII